MTGRRAFRADRQRSPCDALVRDLTGGLTAGKNRTAKLCEIAKRSQLPPLSAESARHVEVRITCVVVLVRRGSWCSWPSPSFLRAHFRTRAIASMGSARTRAGRSATRMVQCRGSLTRAWPSPAWRSRSPHAAATRRSSATRTGTNYDIVSCPLGCDCGVLRLPRVHERSVMQAPRTVCDAGTHLCRGCRIDDECESKVCDLDAGACVAEGDRRLCRADGVTAGVSCHSHVSSARLDSTSRPVHRQRSFACAGLYQTSIDLRTSSFRSISIIARGDDRHRGRRRRSP